MHNKHPDLAFQLLQPAFMRAYVAKAQTFIPTIPRELTETIEGTYALLRKESNISSGKTDKRQRFCTARTLLTILRLSQALARIHFRSEVSKSDVDEAVRLMEVARKSGFTASDRIREDPKSAIYRIIVTEAKNTNNQEVSVASIELQTSTRGYSTTDLEQVMQDYEDLAVWSISPDGKTIRLHDQPSALRVP